MINDNLLREAFACGILKSSEVEQKLNMLKETKVKKLHPYQFHQRDDGRYVTYIRQDGGPRRAVSAKTYQGLIDKLYPFYYQSGKQITLQDLYPEWIQTRRDGKEKRVDIKTIQRNEQHWRKYYAGTPIVDTPVSDITVRMLNRYFNTTVTSFQLSSKELNNMKMIMKSLFAMAMEKELITANPMQDVEITARRRAVRKKSSSQKVFLDKEYETLHDYLKQQHTVQALAILLSTQLGTRVGETVALKKSDVEEKTIYIQRMEVKDVQMQGQDFQTHGTKVADYVKSDAQEGYRHIILTREAKEILTELNELNPESEFLFVGEDGCRMTARSFSYWLSHYCKACGVPYKSPHCIRRTTASRLNANQMPLDEIRRIMGHCDERTTLGYLYNPKEEEETARIMNQAL